MMVVVMMMVVMVYRPQDPGAAGPKIAMRQIPGPAVVMMVMVVVVVRTDLDGQLNLRQAPRGAFRLRALQPFHCVGDRLQQFRIGLGDGDRRRFHRNGGPSRRRSDRGSGRKRGDGPDHGRGFMFHSVFLSISVDSCVPNPEPPQFDPDFKDTSIALRRRSKSARPRAAPSQQRWVYRAFEAADRIGIFAGEMIVVEHDDPAIDHDGPLGVKIRAGQAVILFSVAERAWRRRIRRRGGIG